VYRSRCREGHPWDLAVRLLEVQLPSCCGRQEGPADLNRAGDVAAALSSAYDARARPAQRPNDRLLLPMAKPKLLCICFGDADRKAVRDPSTLSVLRRRLPTPFRGWTHQS
jgi:hypothetical protein